METVHLEEEKKKEEKRKEEEEEEKKKKKISHLLFDHKRNELRTFGGLKTFQGVSVLCFGYINYLDLF